MSKQAIVPISDIESKIIVVRGQRVMLDSDLAELYGVPTKVFNQAVRRNAERFPDDFMYQLTEAEVTRLRSQIVTSKPAGMESTRLRSQIATSNTGRGGRRTAPYVFTEHGAIMAANVLNSPQAVKVGVYVVRAFVKLREMLSARRDLAIKLDELERKYEKHDQQIVALIDAFRQMMSPAPEPKRKPIGYKTESDRK